MGDAVGFSGFVFSWSCAGLAIPLLGLKFPVSTLMVGPFQAAFARGLTRSAALEATVWIRSRKPD
jgi:hypothetical protein